MEPSELEEILKKFNFGEPKKNGFNNVLVTALAIITIITGLAMFIRPMQLQVSGTEERMERIEARHDARLRELDDKLQMEFKSLDAKLQAELQNEIDRAKEQDNKHEADLDRFRQRIHTDMDRLDQQIQENEKEDIRFHTEVGRKRGP